jgi:hypothetical protein
MNGILTVRLFDWAYLPWLTGSLRHIHINIFFPLISPRCMVLFPYCMVDVTVQWAEHHTVMETPYITHI